MINNFESLKQSALKDLEDLQTEISGTISNERVFAIGSFSTDETDMHFHNIKVLDEYLQKIISLTDILKENNDITIKEVINILDISYLYIDIIETEANNNNLYNLQIFYRTVFIDN